MHTHRANSYSAYVADLPGCVAAGKTLAEVEMELRGAAGSTRSLALPQVDIRELS